MNHFFILFLLSACFFVTESWLPLSLVSWNTLFIQLHIAGVEGRTPLVHIVGVEGCTPLVYIVGVEGRTPLVYIVGVEGRTPLVHIVGVEGRTPLVHSPEWRAAHHSCTHLPH